MQPLAPNSPPGLRAKLIRIFSLVNLTPFLSAEVIELGWVFFSLFV